VTEGIFRIRYKQTHVKQIRKLNDCRMRNKTRGIGVFRAGISERITCPTTFRLITVLFSTGITPCKNVRHFCLISAPNNPPRTIQSKRVSLSTDWWTFLQFTVGFPKGVSFFYFTSNVTSILALSVVSKLFLRSSLPAQKRNVTSYERGEYPRIISLPPCFISHSLLLPPKKSQSPRKGLRYYRFKRSKLFDSFWK